MKYLFLTIVSFLLVINVYSQIMQPKWETCLGGTDWDEGTGLIKVNIVVR